MTRTGLSPGSVALEYRLWLEDRRLRLSRTMGTKTSTSWSTIFGRNGRAYREADVEETDLETVIADLLAGQYKNPIRVVGFNTAEKWSQDVSADVAHELRHRCDLQMRDVPFWLAGLRRPLRRSVSRLSAAPPDPPGVNRGVPA